MAKRWGRLLARILGYGFLVLLVLLAVAITFTVGWRPIIGAKKRALTTRTFEATPARLHRGEYLVDAVINCMGCHAKHDEKADPPVLLSKEGAGNVLYDDGNFRLVAANITPDPDTGIGKWSDDAIARAIREGIAADGRTLFPAMPYERFRNMSDEDVASIVVFLRSLPPVHSDLPPAKIPFVFARLVQSVPQPVTEPVTEPDVSTPVKRGTYLLKIATCRDCHTPRDPKFNVIPGLEMAGGAPMDSGVFSANLTPDASGIGYYDEALFIETIRTGYVGARKLNSIMPWWAFRNMTDDDLKAVFAYLRTLKPVHHLVDNAEPPTLCKLCNHKHGGGDHN
ncbi:MAG TPA: cytochrome c [Terriglobales bacterium]|jgi:mono/diheme cytochrome c family protein|nr:cytochrome c [Terriglobales bacterium]